MNDQNTIASLNLVRRDIIASAVLREAGRLADSRDKAPSFVHGNNNRITTADLESAVEDFRNALAEMEKKGL